MDGVKSEMADVERLREKVSPIIRKQSEEVRTLQQGECLLTILYGIPVT